MISEYYKILGLRENCSLEDIKKAYRKLVFKYHPDKNPDKDTTEEFRRVKEAYDLLINHYNKKNNIFGDKSYNKSFSEMFNSMFKGFNYSNRKVVRTSISLQNILNGGVLNMRIPLKVPCKKCSLITRTRCKSCSGFGYTLKYLDKVFTIPKESHPQQVFQLEKDIFLKIDILPHPYFKFKKADVISVKKINILKAILGGIDEVETIRGKETIHIEGGNSGNFTYTLKNKGFKFNKSYGSHIIKYETYVPDNLSEEHKKVLDKILYETEKKDKTENKKD